VRAYVYTVSVMKFELDLGHSICQVLQNQLDNFILCDRSETIQNRGCIYIMVH